MRVVKNIFGTKSMGETMQIAENITGLSVSDPNGASEIMTRIRNGEDRASRYGLSTQGVLQFEAATAQIATAQGYDRRTAGSMAARIGDSVMNVWDTRMKQRTRLAAKGIYMSAPSAEEIGAQEMQGQIALGEEEPELSAAMYFANTATDLSDENRRAIKNAARNFAKARGTNAEADARGELNRLAAGTAGAGNWRDVYTRAHGFKGIMSNMDSQGQSELTDLLHAKDTTRMQEQVHYMAERGDFASRFGLSGDDVNGVMDTAFFGMDTSSRNDLIEALQAGGSGVEDKIRQIMKGASGVGDGIGAATQMINANSSSGGRLGKMLAQGRQMIGAEPAFQSLQSAGDAADDLRRKNIASMNHIMYGGDGVAETDIISSMVRGAAGGLNLTDDQVAQFAKARGGVAAGSLLEISGGENGITVDDAKAQKLMDTLPGLAAALGVDGKGAGAVREALNSANGFQALTTSLRNSGLKFGAVSATKDGVQSITGYTMFTSKDAYDKSANDAEAAMSAAYLSKLTGRSAEEIQRDFAGKDGKGIDQDKVKLSAEKLGGQMMTNMGSLVEQMNSDDAPSRSGAIDAAVAYDKASSGGFRSAVAGYIEKEEKRLKETSSLRPWTKDGIQKNIDNARKVEEALRDKSENQYLGELKVVMDDSLRMRLSQTSRKK